MNKQHGILNQGSTKVNKDIYKYMSGVCKEVYVQNRALQKRALQKFYQLI